MMLLALLMPSAWATDFLQTDAGAPGMAVQVNILREAGGFTGSEVITTSCSDIVVGPVSALDRGGDPSAPVSGAVLSTLFFIDDSATTGDCTVYVDGTALAAFSTSVDNLFSIVTPQSAPVDGGTNDLDGTVDGVITLSSSLRSDGGTLVLEELSVGAAETLWFDSTDPDSVSDGNEAYLPVILLVDGEVSIEGTVDLAGWDGDYGYTWAGEGGDGGLGGGGGGVGGNCVSGVGTYPGDGFSGGGGGVTDGCTLYQDGGHGALEGPDSEHGGEGLYTTVENGIIGHAGGSGGGTGVPWGTGGGGGMAHVVAGAGGYGGGGASGHSDAAGWGQGGGGFGTDGENGVGTVGGSVSSDDSTGGAGLECGHETLVPLAGGSGGAGGESGSSWDGGGGGGGGGSLYLQAQSITLGSGALIDVHGGDGGDTRGYNPGSSTGGGAGSGGGVHLVSLDIYGLSSSTLDLGGGYAGSSYGGSGYTAYYSGDGGEGRLRVDGDEVPSLATGPTGYTASTWQGPAIVDVSGTEVSIESSGACTLYIYDATGTWVANVSLAEDDTEDIEDELTGGDYYLVLVDDSTGVMSAAGAAVLDYVPDKDGDGYYDVDYGGTDCDDSDGDVSPVADEYCDGVDNDCDGDVDESDAIDASEWYLDDDGDGYGDADSTTEACDEPTGYVSDDTDCDDTDAETYPGADEYCDGEDDDCDGTMDEDDAVDADTWYMDMDADGYGTSRFSTAACDQPSGYVDNDDDCDDLDASSYPGGDEVCDGADNDCDGDTDDADSSLDTTTATTWYADTDSDGYGDATSTALTCDQPSGYLADDSDCDDTDATIFPGADEYCDGEDDDCDGEVDEDSAVDASTWYSDIDGDGFGGGRFTTVACEAPDGFVADTSDCDDLYEYTYPDAAELCDDADNDCDGGVDEDIETLTWYADADGDRWGDAAVSTEDCAQPEGYVLDATDCDDASSSVHPEATEIWYDGVDQDCDEASDYDQDGDGHDAEAFGGEDCDDTEASAFPGGEEVWYDGIDQDCDGNDDDQDGDGWPVDTDCDDTDAEIFPGAMVGTTAWTDDCMQYDVEPEYKGGCDCDSSSTGSGPWLALLGLAGLVGLRRRRR